jgi:hypothetical protein
VALCVAGGYFLTSTSAAAAYRHTTRSSFAYQVNPEKEAAEEEPTKHLKPDDDRGQQHAKPDGDRDQQLAASDEDSKGSAAVKMEDESREEAHGGECGVVTLGARSGGYNVRRDMLSDLRARPARHLP